MSVELVVQAEQERLLAVLDGPLGKPEQQSLCFRSREGRSLGLYPALPFVDGRFSPWDGFGSVTLARLEGAEHAVVRIEQGEASRLRDWLLAQLRLPPERPLRPGRRRRPSPLAR